MLGGPTLRHRLWYSRDSDVHLKRELSGKRRPRLMSILLPLLLLFIRASPPNTVVYIILL